MEMAERCSPFIFVLRDFVASPLLLHCASSVPQYQLHSVVEPLDAAADALADVVRAGLAEAVGVCNHSVAPLRGMHRRLAQRGVTLGSCQAHASLLAQDALMDGTYQFCRAHGVALIAYAPLASGRLARRCGRGPDAAALHPPLIAANRRGFGAVPVARLPPLLDALESAAGPGPGLGPGDVALRWLVAHEGVVAIPGAKSAAQVRANLAGRRQTDWAMDEDVHARLGALGRATAKGSAVAGPPARARLPKVRAPGGSALGVT